MPIADLERSVRNLDAKRDSQFLNYAVETKKIRDLRDLACHSFIGIGVKGIGKSAAFQILSQRRSASDLVIAIDPARYSLGGKVSQDSVPRFATKTRIGILYEILKQIVANKRT
jgi:putative protein kinase ArgK-like GTPase of G3E family